jgi:hypothetical protein
MFRQLKKCNMFKKYRAIADYKLLFKKTSKAFIIYQKATGCYPLFPKIFYEMIFVIPDEECYGRYIIFEESIGPYKPRPLTGVWFIWGI